MAEVLPLTNPEIPSLQINNKKKMSGMSSSNKRTKRKASSEPDRLESEQWNDSIPSDDPFFILAGSNEGGFLSLEEFDEAEYGLTDEGQKSNKKADSLFNLNKRKRESENRSSKEDKEQENETKKQKKKQSNKSRDKKINKNTQKNKNTDKSNQKEENNNNNNNNNNGEVVLANLEDVESNRDDEAELILGEDEVYAWNELRLHPLLIKSICRLGFKEPTPIQKACIPAAAHQGKDVIGAAETGSGKTLAFGLPILQRLLDEREKSARLVQQGKKSADESERSGPLRALIITPTRELALQVCDHLKQAAKSLEIYVVPIVGGMSSEKQERLLKRRPQIVVGTPGRLWELMSAGDPHLIELHSLSFFVLDEADRMIENGHFNELQSIIDMLPLTAGPTGQQQKSAQQTTSNCETVAITPRKKRQTFVFSATISLSSSFRRKLRRGPSTALKSTPPGGLNSIEVLSERAGMRPDAAVVDLTSASIVANKLEESFIECGEEDKDAYLYYILSVHGQGKTMVFCTSIAALRHISSILRILGVTAWTLHAQMQQRARLKAMDRFRANDNAVLIATDVAARGLDIPQVRTVVHYQLPHSAEVYIHRSGRTARAFTDGCSIALISPKDKKIFYALCKSLLKESLRQFPVDDAYMPAVMKRLSLARQIDKITRKDSQENAKKNWFEKNAESLGVDLDLSNSEEERVMGQKQKKNNSAQLKKLQQDLNSLLAKPMQPKTLSRRFLAGAGVSLVLQKQLEELSKRKLVGKESSTDSNKKSRFVVIGQDCVEPLDALRSSGHEVCVNVEKKREMQKLAETWKRKKREEKKGAREQKRKARKKGKERD